MRQAVRRAKLAERGSQIALVTGVPMEGLAYGERWMTPTVGELLDALLRRVIASGAQTATAAWDAMAPPTAPRAGRTVRDWTAR